MPRKYDLEFKLEAVRMGSEPGVTNRDVERRLGIGQGVLSSWKKELERDGPQAFPGKGHSRYALGSDHGNLQVIHQNSSAWVPLMMLRTSFLGVKTGG